MCARADEEEAKEIQHAQGWEATAASAACAEVRACVMPATEVAAGRAAPSQAVSHPQHRHHLPHAQGSTRRRVALLTMPPVARGTSSNAWCPPPAPRAAERRQHGASKGSARLGALRCLSLRSLPIPVHVDLAAGGLPVCVIHGHPGCLTSRCFCR